MTIDQLLLDPKYLLSGLVERADGSGHHCCYYCCYCSSEEEEEETAEKHCHHCLLQSYCDDVCDDDACGDDAYDGDEWAEMAVEGKAVVVLDRKQIASFSRNPCHSQWQIHCKRLALPMPS